MLKPLIEGFMGFLKHKVKQNEIHAFTFCFETGSSSLDQVSLELSKKPILTSDS